MMRPVNPYPVGLDLEGRRVVVIGGGVSDAGELLLTRATALMTDITGLRAELSALNETPQGTLRISCLPTFGKTYVLPLLPTLLTKLLPRLNKPRTLLKKPLRSNQRASAL